MSKLKYTLELTADEAAALVMLTSTGIGAFDGWLGERLTDIAAALEYAAPELKGRQFKLWKAHSEPHVHINYLSTEE